ncbi:hypothetical protein Bca52824_068963 [Brassica carinata]|uniref:Ornithine aminotransferase n=1 Tax=Brassica carinata TaxID=52824 RepID=A0A8X7U1Q5_BRACI|nr:hypothetical protein Bca52824_068963 [Brassica carinata]
MFGYEMVLPMNTGAEGVETALKVARKWGHEKKNIPKDEAIIVSCCGCFHGRTLAVISMSCDNDATRGFGPLLPGNLKVDFGDADSLEKIFKEKGDKIAGFLFEPIQGEAGVVIPPEGYLKAVRALCTKHNVLMIADEVQSGLARSGKMLACDWEEIRPDMVILGKALGGGVIPVSAVLADKDVMLHIKPGQHGSTFGGNPLASAVAMASLDVIEEEKLVERSASLGEELRIQLNEIKKQFPDYIKEVRGRGLFNAVEFNSESLSPVSAYDICLSLKERGVLAKPTHNTIVRLTPPLSISSDELREGSKALHDVLEVDLPNLQKSMLVKPRWLESVALDQQNVDRFVPVGFVTLRASRHVIEIIDPYDVDCIPQEYKTNKQFYITDSSISKSCTRYLKGQKYMKAPIFIYYQLDNYYQNHRRVEVINNCYMDGSIVTQVLVNRGVI